MQIQDTNEKHTQVLENGRMYYANEKIAYILPRDIDECVRLEKQHYGLKSLFQSNFNAPVKKQLEEGITVLDAGCGPGYWTLDMAKEYPNSKFRGVDVSNFFPLKSKPDNCEFVIGNITETLPYKDNTFDYIHQRMLLLGLTNSSWDKCLKELLRVLKPGGYIEIIDNTVSSMLESRDIPADIPLQLEERMNRAGYVNLVETRSFLPLNHGGKAGKLMWQDFYHGFLNVRPLMVKYNPEWNDPQAYELFIQNCAIEANAHKTSLNWYIFCAQKTLNNI
ncbi:S-adenosyl-L-methionine-dependent methyltransferase [Helicostylum pulchrum]|nr:S-adenosyl-L-methionine-dependent methyltransferase [Helicostylum pulchrum]